MLMAAISSIHLLPDGPLEAAGFARFAGNKRQDAPCECDSHIEKVQRRETEQGAKTWDRECGELKSARGGQRTREGRIGRQSLRAEDGVLRRSARISVKRSWAVTRLPNVIVRVRGEALP